MGYTWPRALGELLQIDYKLVRMSESQNDIMEKLFPLVMQHISQVLLTFLQYVTLELVIKRVNGVMKKEGVHLYLFW